MSKNSVTQELSNFIADCGLTMTSEILSSRGEEWKNKFHLTITLSTPKSSMTFPYSSGWTKPKKLHQPCGYETVEAKRPKVSIEDVLYCVVMEAFYTSNTFEEWCSSFGESTDSRKALETYLLCQKHRNELIKMVGYDSFNKLVELYEGY